MTRLSGPRAVVTGGGSGLGLTTARRMAAHDARIACADLDPSALPSLKRSAIVNTGSVAASARRQALALAMASHHLDDGIRVNCVNPGTVDTPWVQRLLDQAADPAAERAALEARQLIRRLVSADEAAPAMAGPEAASSAGTVLAVDGGRHGLRRRR
jgi:2-keto-3-deoxy-L-fuconate dehydrogenase